MSRPSALTVVLTVAAILSLPSCSAARNSEVCQRADSPLMVAEYQKRRLDPNPMVAFGANVGLAESCVLKTARLLARSPDPATVVAEAVVAQCEDRIDGYASAYLAQLNPEGMTAVSPQEITTGRDVTAQERAFARMRRKAVAAVVEARAGNCHD